MVSLEDLYLYRFLPHPHLHFSGTLMHIFLDR